MKLVILFLLLCFVILFPQQKEYFKTLSSYSKAVCRVQRYFKDKVVTRVEIVSSNTLNVQVFDPSSLVSNIHRVTLGDDIQVTRYVTDVPRKTVKHDTFFA